MGAKEKEKMIDNKKDNKPLKTEVSSNKEMRKFSFPKAKLSNKIKIIVSGPGHLQD